MSIIVSEILRREAIRNYFKLLTRANQALFLNVLGTTASADSSRLEDCAMYMQHGSTSVLMHVIAVAIVALYIAQKLNIRVQKEELIRGALLHDYFLYDWHEPDKSHRGHGFTHPRTALHQAGMDFDLTDRERDMILRHMFPLTPVPPRYRESVILCVADKYVAARETIHRSSGTV